MPWAQPSTAKPGGQLPGWLAQARGARQARAPRRSPEFRHNAIPRPWCKHKPAASWRAGSYAAFRTGCRAPSGSLGPQLWHWLRAGQQARRQGRAVWGGVLQQLLRAAGAGQAAAGPGGDLAEGGHVRQAGEVRRRGLQAGPQLQALLQQPASTARAALRVWLPCGHPGASPHSGSAACADPVACQHTVLSGRSACGAGAGPEQGAQACSGQQRSRLAELRMQPDWQLQDLHLAGPAVTCHWGQPGSPVQGHQVGGGLPGDAKGACQRAQLLQAGLHRHRRGPRLLPAVGAGVHQILHGLAALLRHPALLGGLKGWRTESPCVQSSSGAAQGALEAPGQGVDGGRLLRHALPDDDLQAPAWSEARPA